jgi:hypothetical protein
VVFNQETILISGSVMDRMSELSTPPSAIIVGLVSPGDEPLKLPGVRLPVVGLPLDVASTEKLFKSIEQAGVVDRDAAMPVLVLPTDFSSADVGQLQQRLATWAPLAKQTGMLIHASGVPATTLLLAASRIGLLPVRMPFSPDANRHTARWWLMEPQPYRIRLATVDDHDALEDVYTQSAAAHLRPSASDLATLTQDAPKGQLVLETESGLSAVIHSLRIDATDTLSDSNSQTVLARHAPNGKTTLITAVAATPLAQSYGWGTQLYDFMLVYAACVQDVMEIAVVTHCVDYPLHGERTYEEYMARRDANGNALDPMLRYHEDRGASIVGILPNYRPDDMDNGRRGVLVTYTPENILIRKTQRRQKPHNEEPVRLHEARRVVSRLVLGVLDKVNAYHYKTDATFESLGIDSLQLEKLRQQINTAFHCDTDPDFFHRNPTADAVMESLVTAKGEDEETVA